MKKIIQKCLLFLAVPCILLAAGYWGLMYYYKQNIPYGTWVNDIYCTGMSYDEVADKLLEQDQLIPGKEKAWLMQVTANECRDLLRSSWWRRTVPLEQAFQIPKNQTDETIYLLQTLPPKYRVVLYLHYYEQYTTPEIAQLLKIPTGTVSTRLKRARDRLKTMLKEG